MTAKIGIATILISLLALATACGDDNTAQDVSETPASPTPVPEAELPLPDPWEVHIAAADGSGETQVFVADRASWYEWSPDSSKLAIATQDGVSTAIHFVALDGEELGQTTVDGSAGYLTWSPDGRYLVGTFFSTRTSLVAVASDGSGQRDLLSAPPAGSLDFSVWLASGELLVRVSEPGGDERFAALDVEAGTSRDLQFDIPAQSVGSFVISPDGRFLAAQALLSASGCGSPDNGFAIWTIRSGLFTIEPDGSGMRQVTRGAAIQDIEWIDKDTLRFTTYQSGL